LPCIVAKQQKASIYIYVDGDCTIGGWKQKPNHHIDCHSEADHSERWEKIDLVVLERNLKGEF